ncbi:hypothetical protein D3C78_1767290 [compost metagenome]
MQQFGDHANDAATGREHFIGHHAHDADDGSAVHQPQVALDQFAGQYAGLLDVVRAGAGIRAAIYADVLQVHNRFEMAGPVTDCVTGVPGSR